MENEYMLSKYTNIQSTKIAYNRTNKAALSIEDFDINEPFFDKEFEANQYFLTDDKTMLTDAFNKTDEQAIYIKAKHTVSKYFKKMWIQSNRQSNGKYCPTCKTTKHISNFRKKTKNERSSKDGYNRECKHCVRIRVRENKRNNRKRTSKQQIDYIQRRTKNDPIFKLCQLERSRLYMACKYFNLNKEHKTMEYIGCSGDELARHLQSTAIANGYVNFDIMNYSSEDFHIDHRIPVKAIDNGDATMEEVFHYSNLQILKASDNLSKHDNY